jgi:hypothetical protein
MWGCGDVGMRENGRMEESRREKGEGRREKEMIKPPN